jgi:hypothetical protein
VIAIAPSFALTIPLYGSGMGLAILPVVIRMLAAPVLLTVLAGLGIDWVSLPPVAVVVGFASSLAVGVVADALLRAIAAGQEGLLAVPATAWATAPGAGGCAGHPSIFSRRPI